MHGRGNAALRFGDQLAFQHLLTDQHHRAGRLPDVLQQRHVKPRRQGQGTQRRICGALYVSCSGRGGRHFGGPSAELQTVHRALGDVPLVGFFASGEIAAHWLYGYTGLLTVFVAPADTA